MKFLAALLFLGSCLSSEARSNTQDGIDKSIAKAQKKFRSYQSDPMNLLRGIEGGEYDQIYIQYHGCVWSEFSDGNDEEDSGCNGGGDDNDTPWYMGNTQCYRANVAYSLYGVRTGDDVPENACRKRYYINTFFTKNGMDDFGNLLGLAYYGDATSQCTMVDNDNDDGGNDDSVQHNSQLYPNAQSYTTYCSDGNFVTAMFRGAYCTGKGEMEILNTLADFNNELQDVDCALVYFAEDYSDDDNYGNNANGRRIEGDEGEEKSQDEDQGEQQEEGEEQEGDEDDNEGTTIWDLLSYSDTCSILEYLEGCPDPYNVKRRYDLNPRSSPGIDWLTTILFVLGTLLLLLNCCILDRAKDSNKSKKRGFGLRRSRSRSPMGFRRGRSKSQDRSKSPSRTRRSNSKSKDKGDADTVGSNGEIVKKKGIKGFFSRKK